MHRPVNCDLQSSESKPWWKANFFISEPVLFGTWDGVFTSCMINIFSVIIFLRTGWMVVSCRNLLPSVALVISTLSLALKIFSVVFFACSDSG